MIENKMAASKFMDKMKQIEFLLCKKQFFALRGLQRAMPDESVRFLQSIEIDAHMDFSIRESRTSPIQRRLHNAKE